MPNFVRGSMAGLSAALLLAISLGAAAPHGRPSVQFVSPGESIQAAIDNAEDGGSVFVRPGVYHETANVTNGLNITRGVNLIGLSTARERVVLENAGNQRNGIVVVPSDRTACLTCHSSLAPPFPLLSGVPKGVRMQPMIRTLLIKGVTLRGFANNGLFTENVDGFTIEDVESIGNANYGIFPTLSKNGVVRRNRATGSGDSGIWVETSESVLVADNLVEGNLIGFEISNSEDVALVNNETRGNSLGVATFVLPGLARSGAKRITISNNFIHDNNRPNSAPPGSLTGGLPAGTGILHMGVDDSLIEGNRIQDHNLAGIAVVDVCVAWAGTRLDCSVNPRVTSAFLADQDATNNRIVKNVLVRNGMAPGPSPFAFAASDLALLSFGSGNCYEKNTFATSFSIIGMLPRCQ